MSRVSPFISLSVNERMEERIWSGNSGKPLLGRVLIEFDYSNLKSAKIQKLSQFQKLLQNL